MASSESERSGTHALTGTPAARRWPLRVHLLTVLLLMMVAVAGSIVAFNYVKGRDAALVSAQELMDARMDVIEERQRSVFREIDMFVRVAAINERLATPGLSSRSDQVRFLAEALARAKALDGLYVGYEDGSFLHVVDLSDAPDWGTLLLPPESAVRAVRLVMPSASGGRLAQWSFYNANGSTLGATAPFPIDFDPRTRPWYQGAMKAGAASWTRPYVFASTKIVGVTFSQRLASGTGVIGADVTLPQIGSFLLSQTISPSSIAIIFNRDGELIGYPRIGRLLQQVASSGDAFRPPRVQDAANPALDALYEALARDGWPATASLAFAAGGQNLIARVRTLPDDAGPGGYIALIAPEAELTESATLIGRQALAISLVILGLAVPFVVLIARRMSRALSDLAVETERLQSFDLDASVPIRSRVLEIAQVAEALGRAKSALRVFGLYMPKALVQKIIRLGIEPEPGGERKPLSILFTDIQDFTTISEEADPEVLMQFLTEYFNIMTRGVHEHGGTINELIGDAVFAMWNAPEPTDDHAALACRCALALKDRVAAFNSAQPARGRPPLVTRFGVHTGDAVVGNVGDNERLEYTALGDTINVAARLESLNTRFGTRILASGAIVAAVGDRFRFRYMDSVVPKGRHAPVEVYELIEEARAS